MFCWLTLWFEANTIIIITNYISIQNISIDSQEYNQKY